MTTLRLLPAQNTCAAPFQASDFSYQTTNLSHQASCDMNWDSTFYIKNESHINPNEPVRILNSLFESSPTPEHSLSDDERKKLLSVASQWDENSTIHYKMGASSNSAIDCSHLVHKIYLGAGISYPYTASRGDWNSAGFKKIELTNAKPGDLILWEGHVGILIDAKNQTFLAISSTAKNNPIRITSFGPNSSWSDKPYQILQYQKN